MDVLEKDAYCGPLGDCTGDLNIHVWVHRPAAGVILECGLEEETRKDRDSSVSDHVHVDVCRGNVTDAEASCTIPMPKTIPAGETVDGFCRLVEADGGKVLTQDAPMHITNHHAASAKEEKEPQNEKKEKKKAEAVKSAAAAPLCASALVLVGFLLISLN